MGLKDRKKDVLVGGLGKTKLYMQSFISQWLSKLIKNTL